MDNDGISHLILDALYYRRPTSGDSCLVSNVAGLDLLKADSSALERIEKILCDVVAPRTGSRVRDEFLGLDYLFGAYAIIGSRYDPSRVVTFVQTMPVPLQAEFVAVLPVFFRRCEGAYSFGVAPAPDLLDLVEKFCSSETEALRKAAERAISFLTAQPIRR